MMTAKKHPFSLHEVTPAREKRKCIFSDVRRYVSTLGKHNSCLQCLLFFCCAVGVVKISFQFGEHAVSPLHVEKEVKREKESRAALSQA